MPDDTEPTPSVLFNRLLHRLDAERQEAADRAHKRACREMLENQQAKAIQDTARRVVCLTARGEIKVMRQEHNGGPEGCAVFLLERYHDADHREAALETLLCVRIDSDEEGHVRYHLDERTVPLASVYDAIAAIVVRYRVG